MSSETTNSFMPLFRSWIATTNMASNIDGSTLADDKADLLADVDLWPMEDAEKKLLRHTPASAAEAACLLEVILQNLADSGRSDGLDARALEAVQTWLARVALEGADDDAVARLLHQLGQR